MSARILIVDDSVVFRSAISKALTGTKGIATVKAVANGKLCLDSLRIEEYDIITLDIEMPEMDGLQTLREIRKVNKKIGIIMFSAISTQQAVKTIEALQAGADDFVTKNSETTDVEKNIQRVRDELLPRINALYEKHKGNFKQSIPVKTNSIEATTNKHRPMVKQPKIVCIGCSTGGPDALKRIFIELKSQTKFPILVVQHMPPMFTTQLAKLLSDISEIKVKEAEQDDVLETGRAYLAPGDFHMKIAKKGTHNIINIEQSEKVCFVRPSVDVTFNSIALLYGPDILSIILTGMGEDGVFGCKQIKEAGGSVVIQDRDSSVVWGMPGMVAKAGIQDQELNLEQIAKLINSYA